MYKCEIVLLEQREACDWGMSPKLAHTQLGLSAGPRRCRGWGLKASADECGAGWGVPRDGSRAQLVSSQPLLHAGSLASVLPCPDGAAWIASGGDIKQENVATDLVGFYRELTQCVGAGMTQKVPVGRLDGWAWRLALCAEQKQGSM